jgi:hypothetical protein
VFGFMGSFIEIGGDGARWSFRMKYLHQLQNAYFVLTGHELDSNENIIFNFAE